MSGGQGKGLLGAAGILGRIAGASRVLWFIDFDGTLAPIAPRPEMVTLDEEGRGALALLAARSDFRTAVVSGRPLSFVRRQVRLRRVACAGNHGLEISGPGLKFTHPGAIAARPALREVKRRWGRLRRSWPGSLVEDKGLSVTFHYRQVNPARHGEARRAALAAAGDLRSPEGLRLTEGKKVVEARPPMTWGKGDALHRLLEHWEYRRASDLVVVLGDDVTDRDMFRPVRRHGIAVFVGRGTPPPEATARLAGPGEVRRVLRRAAARGGVRPTSGRG